MKLRVIFPLQTTSYLFVVYQRFGARIHVNSYVLSMSITVQQDATVYTLLHFCKLLYIFRVIHSPIIKSTYKLYVCNM